MQCPICHKTIDRNDESLPLPFCSARCKMIDAKRWLCEEYAIETPTIDEDELEKEILDAETRNLDRE